MPAHTPDPNFSGGALPGAAMTPADQVRKTLGFSQSIKPAAAQLAEVLRAHKQGEEPVEHVSPLIAHVNQLWQSANRAYFSRNERTLDAIRQRKGEYTEGERAHISRQGGSMLFMNLTKEKCRGLEAWLTDIFFPADGDSWDMKPTPLPELSEQDQRDVVNQVIEAEQELAAAGIVVSQQAMLSRAGQLNQNLRQAVDDDAKAAAGRMKRLMKDQLVQGNWERAFKRFLYFFVTCDVGYLRGPVVRRRTRPAWVPDEKGGSKYETRERLTLEWDAPHPSDVYPCPTATEPGDSWYFIRHHYYAHDLAAMKGLPGFSDAQIDALIAAYGVQGMIERELQDTTRERMEDRPVQIQADDDGRIEVREYCGNLTGGYLIDQGMTEIDEALRYAPLRVSLWYCNQFVIRVKVFDDEIHDQLFKCSYESNPDAWTGEGVPFIIRDCQEMCNALARALSNNTGLASGPQVVINDSERFETESTDTLEPWKVWEFGPDKSMATGYNRPLEFFQPAMMGDQIMKVYEYFSALASDMIGVPDYPFKELKGAAKGTASGLSIAMGQGNKQLRNLTRNISRQVVEPALKGLYHYNMKYHADESVKGDLQCVVMGYDAEVAKEHKLVRLVEFLGMTANPTDALILGVEGRAKLLVEVAQKMELDLSDVLPDDEERLRKMVMDNMQLMGMGGDGDPQGKPVGTGVDGQPAGGQDASLHQGADRPRVN